MEKFLHKYSHIFHGASYTKKKRYLSEIQIYLGITYYFLVIRPDNSILQFWLDTYTCLSHGMTVAYDTSFRLLQLV